MPDPGSGRGAIDIGQSLVLYLDYKKHILVGKKQ